MISRRLRGFTEGNYSNNHSSAGDEPLRSPNLWVGGLTHFFHAISPKAEAIESRNRPVYRQEIGSTAARTETCIIKADEHLQSVLTLCQPLGNLSLVRQQRPCENDTIGHLRPPTPCAKNVLVGGSESRIADDVPLPYAIRLERLPRLDGEHVRQPRTEIFLPCQGDSLRLCSFLPSKR